MNITTRRALLIRTATVFASVLILALICILRLLMLGSSEYLNATAQKNSYSINISRLRGTIFDTNYKPITNANDAIYAIITPTEQAIVKLSSVLQGDQLNNTLEKLRKNNIAVVKVKNEIICEGIECVKVKENVSENSLAKHIVGYMDASGHGVSGLQQAYDDILYTDSFINLKYSCDAKGNLLYNKTEIDYEKSVYNSGVITTIDLNIQRITEEAMSSVDRGAAVVLEAKTGKIRAMVSKPDYDQTNVLKYLDDVNSPLINRALSGYDVGSVFKPCIAAAALEYDEQLADEYICVGKEQINGRNFVCNKHDGHGAVNIDTAMAYSCNTYFYTLAIKTGAEQLYSCANNYPFGQSIMLAPGIKSSSGNLTSFYRLKSSNAAIANFAIGQGDLLISPVALITLYDAIASKGVYKLPTIVEGTVKNGVVKRYALPADTRVFSEKTANKITSYLQNVVLYGTGTKAMPKLCSAVGKTATAQTGTKINGKNVSNGWFCGFFPAEEPKYVVAIVVEGAGSGGNDVAPIFSNIADATVNAGLLKGVK